MVHIDKGGCAMKNFLCAIAAVSLLAACSSPVLRWIDLPEGGDKNGDKAIISLSFNIDGEIILPIGTTPDSSGKAPIVAILPAGTSVNALSPQIEFIGKSLNPPPSRSTDFSSPRPYTVTARDGSTLDYLVTVFVKTDASKEIVRFALELSSTLTVEGSIDETAGTISLRVPAGTDTRSMTARIAHTGVYVIGPLGHSHPDATFDFTGDFSSATAWRVIAGDGTEKSYTVTVARDKSHDKEITRFSFGNVGEEDIIGGEPRPDGKYPILAIVPSTVTLSNNLTPFVSYTGASISPGPATPLDFSNPVPYTVTAEDHTTRDYVVTVITKDTGFDSTKRITGFYFREPLVEGIIDETAKTIALTVPAGTDLSALRPEIYYIGDSISPRDGQPQDFTDPVGYTVRAHDGTTEPYTVSVFTAPAPPVVDVPGAGSGAKVDVGIDASVTNTSTDSGNYTVIVEYPTYIENPELNITYPSASTVDNETINQILKLLLLQQDREVTHITNETINNYITNNNTNYASISSDVNVDVTVVNPPPDKPADSSTNAEASIDAFYFTKPVAVGTIGTTGAGTPADPVPVTVTVPYGTDLRNLAATICYTGKEIAGIPGPNPLKDSARSFTGDVDYTVKAQDTTTTKTYRVSVSVAKNNAKEITAFAFDGVTPTSAMINAVPTAAGEYPIVVTIPYSQSLTGLTPVITHTGDSITGDCGINDATGPRTVTGSAYDFSAASATATPVVPVKYKVTAEDGSIRTYAVTVRTAAQSSGDDDPVITGFYFTAPLAVGTINQTANAITVVVPTNTNTASLAPTVYFKGMSVTPGSGAAHNFSRPANYTVTA
jgi:hypothetical protein